MGDDTTGNGPRRGPLRTERDFEPTTLPSKRELADQNVVERELVKLGVGVQNATWVVNRNAPGTFVAFSVGRDGRARGAHAQQWDRRGALAIVQLDEIDTPEGTRYYCSIFVWNIFDRRLTDGGISTLDYEGPKRTDVPLDKDKYEWFLTDAHAENPYQAVRRALRRIAGPGNEGYFQFDRFDVGRQPGQQHSTAAPAARSDSLDANEGVTQEPRAGSETGAATAHASKTSDDQGPTNDSTAPRPEPGLDAHDIDDPGAYDGTTLAGDPSDLFDTAPGDMEGGSVWVSASSDRLYLVTPRGWVRHAPLPAEFSDEHYDNANVEGLRNWLDASGEPIVGGDDLPRMPADAHFVGNVGSGAFRTPLGHEGSEAVRERKRGRMKYLAAGAGAAALAMGGVACWPTDEGNEQALMQMQDEAVLAELAAEEAAARATCLEEGGSFDLDTGVCGPAEPTGEQQTSEADAAAAGAEEPAAAEATEEANAGEDRGAPADDAVTVDSCVGSGLSFDTDTGECVRHPDYHAVMGLGPPVTPNDDPEGGQTGSNRQAWRQTPRVDIRQYSAWMADYDEPTADQLYGGTSFPCGAETDDYRITCPLAAGEIGAGRYVIVSTTVDGEIDADGTYLQYGVAFDNGLGDAANYRGQPPFELDLFNDAELWYRLEIDPDGNRVVYVDGFVEGVPGTPRHSSAMAIEFADTMVWVIPREELPDGELRYRVTTFSNDRGPFDIPDPTTSGGDVSGSDVDELAVIPDPVLVAVLGPDVPPDTDGDPRIDLTGADPDGLLADAMVAALEHRWNEAFAADDPTQAVADVLHPFSTLSSGDGCRGFVERIFVGATSIGLTHDGSAFATDGSFVYADVDAEVSYPTGTNEFPIRVAVGLRNEVAPLFDCAKA